MHNVAIDDRQKKSMLVRSLAESLTFIPIVSSAQADMTAEQFDALVRAELGRKSIYKNPTKTCPKLIYHALEIAITFLEI